MSAPRTFMLVTAMLAACGRPPREADVDAASIDSSLLDSSLDGSVVDARPDAESQSSSCDMQQERIKTDCDLPYDIECHKLGPDADWWAQCLAAATCEAIDATFDPRAIPNATLHHCLIYTPNSGPDSVKTCLDGEAAQCGSQLAACEASAACGSWLGCHLSCQERQIPPTELVGNPNIADPYTCHTECDRVHPQAAGPLRDAVYACGCPLSGCPSTFGIIGIHDEIIANTIAHCP